MLPIIKDVFQGLLYL